MAGRGEADPGSGAFAFVALLDADQAGVLEHGEVLRQVACGQVQVGAKVAEFDAACLVSDREDAQSDALVDEVASQLRRVLS